MRKTTRYPASVEPVLTDGRDINPTIAELTGEAGLQETSGSTDAHTGSVAKAWKALPEPDENDPTYYDVPMLKEPVWEWAVPLYYYVGGLTGVALALGAAADVIRAESSRALVRRCQWIGFGGAVVSGGLLIYDLGKPSRFLNMLRVFRPTSPMNVGAWILSGTGGSATGALLFRDVPVAGVVSSITAGVFGLGLATYTGVLLASTAVPVWQQSRRALPILFGSSALASAGCTFDLFRQSEDEQKITDVIGTAGRGLELVAGALMEHHASAVPRVGRPFRRGFSSVLWRSAEVLTAASLVLSLLPNKTRPRRLAAGLLGTAGSLLLRIAVAHLGTVSARDARASFHQQRAGKGQAGVQQSR